MRLATKARDSLWRWAGYAVGFMASRHRPYR
jgi:hypothetical protein